MTLKLEELARLRFIGDRSVDHALEVSALQAIAQFAVVLNESASFIRDAARNIRPVEQQAQNRRIEIYLRNIEPGSSIVPLTVNAEVMKWSEVRGGFQLISQVFVSSSEHRPSPEIPHSLGLEFRKLARLLNPKESIQVTGAWNTSFRITRALGKQIKGYKVGNEAVFLPPPVADMPKRLESGALEAILRSLAAEVPKEEWQRLPSDLTDDLDHYLYGTPKK